MARTDLEQLVLQMDANFTKFQNKLLKAQGAANQSAGRIEKRFKDMNRNISSSFESGLKNFGAGIIAGLGVEQIARAAATAIESIADIGDQATKLGLSTDEFQTLSFAAQLAGVETAALATGMKKLGVNTSEAARGQGEFGAILRANGVSITNANGELKSQVEILGIVANLVKNAASEQDALAIAQIALGKSGNELMNLLQQGAVGVASAMGQASAAGVQFTAEQIAKAQEFDDAIDTLTQKISVGLRGAFLDAAIGAEAFASSAIAALDDVGIKAEDIGNGILAFYRNVPGFGPLFQFGEAAAAKGRAVSAATSNANRNIARPGTETFRDGKGSLPSTPTIIPDTAGIKAAQREAEAAAKRAADAAQRRREQIQGVISGLKFEGDQLKRNDLQREISIALQRAEVAANSEKGRQIAALVTANFNLEKSQKAQAENTKLNAEAEAELMQARIDAAQTANDKLMEVQQEQRDAMLSFAQMGYSAFEAWATGSASAKDALKGLVAQLAQATAQAALFGQGPLAGLFGGSAKGGLFGSLFGGLFGGGTSASIYHSGGIVGQGGPSRDVSPAMFANAPRYHNGGIAGLKPGEVPAILQRGEMVIPRSGMRGSSNSGPANLTVNIIGATGNAEVYRMTQQGVAAAMAQYMKQAPMIDAERQLRN